MRNLKRALSLALAAVMVLGMMVIGAGAAYKDFTDKDEIVNKDAVSTMVALGVINGKDDGSYFDPTGPVTRAEMAKMICVALNGGVDPVLGVKDKPTFTDIKGHWAESYIEFCATSGIIAGRGNGKFDPAGTVTSSEAAKMILVTLGFDPAFSGLTGGNWNMNTNVEANKAGLYEKLTHLNANAPMIRDNAAQMLYNALDSKMVTLDNNAYKTSQYSYTTSTEVQNGTLTTYRLNVISGNSKLTDLDGDTFKTLTDAKAAAKAADSNAVYGTNYTVLNETTPTYTTTTSTATADETLGHKYLSLISVTGVLTKVGYNDVDKDYTATINGIPFEGLKDDPSQFMQENMKVLFKETDNVYGIYQATKGSVMATGYAGDITEPDNGAATSVKIDGTSYKLSSSASSIEVVPFNGVSVGKLSNIDNITTGYSFKLIDQNGDNKADILATVPFSVGKVTYVGKETISTNVPGYTGKDLDDVDVYDGVAKEDIIVLTPAVNTAKELITIAKAEVTSGSITGTKSGNKYLVDGKWLTYTGSDTDLSVNDVIDYVAFGGKLYYANVTSGATGTGTLGMIFKVGDKAKDGVTNASVEAKIILADGTKKTVTLAKVNTLPVTATTSSIDGTGSKDITGKAVTEANKTVADLAGELISYEVNSDGDYEVKTIPAAYNDKKVLGYTGTVDNTTYTEGKSSLTGDSNEIANDATIFVYGADGTAKVITGRELKNSDIQINVTDNIGKTNATTYTSGLYSTVNGFRYLQVGVVKLDKTDSAKVTAGANYGYLTSDAYTTKEGTDTYTNYVLWTANGELLAKEKATANANLKAGNVVSYDVTGDGVIKNVIVESPVLNTVTGYSESTSKMQTLGSSMTKITSDTVVFYINSAKKTGVEGGAISIADKPDGTNYQANALTIDGTQDAYALIIMDANNKMEFGGKVTYTTTDNINAALMASDDVSVDASTLTNSGTVAVADGKTLTVSKADDTQVLTVNVAEGGALVVEDTAIANGMLVVNAAAGADVTVPNGKLFGGSAAMEITSGTVKLTANGNGITVESSDAVITVTDNVTVGAPETINLTGTAKIVGTAGKSIAVNAAATVTAIGTSSFYNDAGVSGTTSASTLTAAAIAGKTFTWGTTYVGTDGDTAVTGWVQQ